MSSQTARWPFCDFCWSTVLPAERWGSLYLAGSITTSSCLYQNHTAKSCTLKMEVASFCVTYWGTRLHIAGDSEFCCVSLDSTGSSEGFLLCSGHVDTLRACREIGHWYWFSPSTYRVTNCLHCVFFVVCDKVDSSLLGSSSVSLGLQVYCDVSLCLWMCKTAGMWRCVSGCASLLGCGAVSLDMQVCCVTVQAQVQFYLRP